MNNARREYIKKEIESFKKDLEKQFEFLVKNADLIRIIAKRKHEISHKERNEKPYKYDWNKLAATKSPVSLFFTIGLDGELGIEAELENYNEYGDLIENHFESMKAKYLYDDSELVERESKIKEPSPEDIKNAKIKSIKDQIKFYEDKLKAIEEGN